MLFTLIKTIKKNFFFSTYIGEILNRKKEKKKKRKYIERFKSRHFYFIFKIRKKKNMVEFCFTLTTSWRYPKQCLEAYNISSISQKCILLFVYISYFRNRFPDSSKLKGSWQSFYGKINLLVSIPAGHVLKSVFVPLYVKCLQCRSFIPRANKLFRLLYYWYVVVLRMQIWYVILKFLTVTEKLLIRSVKCKDLVLRSIAL